MNSNQLFSNIVHKLDALERYYSQCEEIVIRSTDGKKLSIDAHRGLTILTALEICGVQYLYWRLPTQKITADLVTFCVGAKRIADYFSLKDDEISEFASGYLLWMSMATRSHGQARVVSVGNTTTDEIVSWLAVHAHQLGLEIVTSETTPAAEGGLAKIEIWNGCHCGKCDHAIRPLARFQNVVPDEMDYLRTRVLPVPLVFVDLWHLYHDKHQVTFFFSAEDATAARTLAFDFQRAFEGQMMLAFEASSPASLNNSKKGTTPRRLERANLFRKLKTASPGLSLVALANKVKLIPGYEDVTEDAVRNDYKLMGWRWERANRIR